MNLLREIEEFDVKGLTGMFFSEYKIEDKGTLVFSDVVEDTGWNFVTFLDLDNIEDFENQIKIWKKEFQGRNRRLAICVSNTANITKKIKDILENEYIKQYTDSWMILKDNKFASCKMYGNCKVERIDKNLQKEIFINTYVTSRQSVLEGDFMEKMPECYKVALNNSFDYRGDYQYERYLIWLNDEPIGMGVAVIKDKMAGIYGIGIYAEHRKNGYGTVLMNGIISDLQKRGLEKIYLITEVDTYVEKWYRKWGFETINNTTCYVMKDKD